jgi:hypothetical protein
LALLGGGGTFKEEESSGRLQVIEGMPLKGTVGHWSSTLSFSPGHKVNDFVPHLMPPITCCLTTGPKEKANQLWTEISKINISLYKFIISGILQLRKATD